MKTPNNRLMDFNQKGSIFRSLPRNCLSTEKEETFAGELKLHILTCKPIYGYMHKSNDPFDCCVMENFKI